MKYDVVILGGGMAGLISSIYLSDKGYKTALVSKGDPICCISSGCIDLLASDKNPLDDIKNLPEDHPYKMVGRDNLKKALLFFKKIMNEAGLPYFGNEEENRIIFSPIAKKRKTSLVPFSMVEANIEENESIHVISFKGIKDFFPGYFTDKFEDSKCSEYENAAKTTIGIATQFDEPLFRNSFLDWIEGLNIQEDKIAIPAVLGTKNPEGLMNEIESRTGKKIFEIPTLPPSIPGLRLFRTLKKAAAEKGVDLFWGHAISDYKEVNNILTTLFIDQPGRPTVIEGKSFILATGSFVSGGLFAEKTTVRETVFNLPVSIPAGEQRLSDSFFDPDHPLGKAGIKISEDYRPVERNIKNLFIGGSILENSQIMNYQCGHGLAIATGLEAAKSCEVYLK
ncbi:MAG: anaerobic glycerol-3-phosphate dehydrogenase subunit GlpB [Spirochaetaceae bacterium]|jgi:glycerol-3-phosphate dehydrogenase subunit B|nr:anaerobic glycerol-3-phosphate dehydrogenase subunit GlpB [Spirochaetaceae bacterium]